MRSLNTIEKLIKEGLKRDGYPDADSYSKRQIIRVIEQCFQEIAESNPIYQTSTDLAYQMAKAQILAALHITQDELDAYYGRN